MPMGTTMTIQQCISNALEEKINSTMDKTVMVMVAELDDEMALVGYKDLHIAAECALMDGEGREKDGNNVNI
eukprot:13277705-Ditylum_brightwellii.AAC.1